MSQPINSDPRYGKQPTAGREYILGLPKLGISSSEYQNPVNSLFMRTAPVNYRNYFMEWRDVDPINKSTLRFGDKCVIPYGNESAADLVGSELHFRLPRLYRKDGPFTSANGNPADGTPPGSTYQAVAPSGGIGPALGDYLEWQPFIGELIQGGLSGKVYQRHGSETTRAHTPHEIHFKRRICEDSEATSKRDVYINGAGGLVDNTNVAVDLVVKNWLPHMPDVGRTYDSMLPMQAFGQQFEYEFQIAPIQECIRTNIPLASLNTSDGREDSRPIIFMRNYYVVNELAHRNATAMETMTETGIQYQTTHTITERDYEINASNVDLEVAIDIEYNRNPTSFTLITLHYKDDLAAAGTIATAADVDPDPTTKRTYNSGGTEFIGRPNWLATIPPTAWWVQDSSEKVTNEYSMGPWLNSQVGGHTNFFASTPSEDYALIPWCVAPAVENNGVGQQDFSSMKKPRVHVVVPPNNAKNVNQKRIARVTNFTRNSFTAVQGQTVRNWNI